MSTERRPLGHSDLKSPQPLRNERDGFTVFKISSGFWDKLSLTNRVVFTGAWFGLVAGLVEAGLYLWIQHVRAPEIVYTAILFDASLFVLAALGIMVTAKLVPQIPVLEAVASFLAMMMFFDWSCVVVSASGYSIPLLLTACGLAALLNRLFRKHGRRLESIGTRSLPWIAGLGALCIMIVVLGVPLRERAALAQLPPAALDSPNILVIVIDTLRADHLSGYGYGRQTSPNLDILASQGVLFENAIAPSSWTLPSHASMLTGLYPHQHGAETLEGQLNQQSPTIAEALRALGYRTAAFSANTGLFSRRTAMNRGFIHFRDSFQSIGDAIAHTFYGAKFGGLLRRIDKKRDAFGRVTAADINEGALRWLENDRQPFFLMLNYFDVHDPYLPPEPYRHRFSKEKNLGGLVSITERLLPHLGPEQLQSEMNAYDGGIVYVDDQIRGLMFELQKRGLARNLLVIVTSDHGESFGEHGLILHGNALYRQLIHVPLIIYWPGHLPPGTRIQRPVTTAALPVTLMSLLNRERYAAFPQRPLSELWTNSATSGTWPDPESELAKLPISAEFPSYYGSIESIATVRWHYILHQRFGPELYDWSSDLQETHNLAGDPCCLALGARLASELRAVTSETMAIRH